MKDLSSSHYKLGYDPNQSKISSNMAAYQPLEFSARPQSSISSTLRKSNLEFNPLGTHQKGKTIYMTDYTKKEIEQE